MQSALLFPHLSQIKLLISTAGSLYTDIPYYGIPGPKLILGKRPPPPWKAEGIIRDYLKRMEAGAVRTSGDPIEMWEFLTCVLQQAYLPRWLGMKKGNERLDVMTMVERVKVMPPVWVVQGEQDSVVSGFLYAFESHVKNIGRLGNADGYQFVRFPPFAPLDLWTS